MGIVCWLLPIFIVFLVVKLFLYIYKEKVDKLQKTSKALKYIHFAQNCSESLYNYLIVNQIISLTSLVLYLWYEYYEKSCF
jgi:hypothetical protein